ncbi:hypothetical protein DFJ74DRAFT_326941 [Hyaloraphidium curvatum]|nr:hypothetical protein DFJ74DRAFT_326941 [Hyaloraphidium curvatum]
MTATAEPGPDGPAESLLYEGLPLFRVLLLGEGNFAFARALAHFLWDEREVAGPAAFFLDLPDLYRTRPHLVQLVATSFDTRAQVVSKYHDSRVLLASLDQACEAASLRIGVPPDSDDASRVMHEVNAWDLDSVFPRTRFDRIAWNHPHLGTEDFRLHRCLLAHFFRSAAGRIVSGGRVQVSLLEGQDGRWEIVSQATKGGLLAHRSKEGFDEREYPGYEPKRNKTGQSFKNEKTRKHTGSEMRSWCWVFAEEGQVAPGQGQEVAGDANGEALGEAEGAVDGRLSPASSEDARPSPAAKRQAAPATAAKPFACPHCPRTFATARAHGSHVYQIHVLQVEGADWSPEPELKHVCEDCGRRYGSEHRLFQHRTNKHDRVSRGELVALFGEEGADEEEAGRRNGLEKEDAGYDFFPCGTCGLAVVDQPWGMQMHLENLKPVLGLEMRCPRTAEDGCGRCFIERRALWQHWKFCRLKGEFMLSNGTAGVGAAQGDGDAGIRHGQKKKETAALAGANVAV